MTKDKSKDTDRDFLLRFEKLSDEVPVDEAEAQEILRDAGIDVAAALKEAMAHVAVVEERLKRQRFAQAEAEREAALANRRLPSKKRTPAELRARLGELRSAAGAQALFRGLDSVEGEDLEVLVAQLEELVARGQDKK
jgi:MoxR-like ATPase